MSKFDDVVSTCKDQMDKCGIAVDEKLLRAVAKGLGPSIYNKDALLVAAGDKTEVDGIKERFIGKKLGVTAAAEADAAVAHAVEKIGSANRQKLRPVFYYLIVKHLGKESVYD
ncbi:MAG: DUF2853 family protein [Granulosicoccaceae bacterium]